MKYKYLEDTVTITDASVAKLFAVQEHPGSWCWSRTVAGERAYTRLSHPDPVSRSSSPSAGRGLLWSFISLALASCNSCGKSPNSLVPSVRNWPPPQFLSAQATARAAPPRFHITDGTELLPGVWRNPTSCAEVAPFWDAVVTPRAFWVWDHTDRERVWRAWMHPWACICRCRAGGGKQSVETILLAGILGLTIIILVMLISGGITLLSPCCCSSHVFSHPVFFHDPDTSELLDSFSGKRLLRKAKNFLTYLSGKSVKPAEVWHRRTNSPAKAAVYHAW